MNNIGRHPNCSMRTEIGNCDPIGGFCTSVNENVCDALHKVSRPKGEWVLSDNPNNLYECSNCGHGFPHKRNSKSTVFYFQNYCPNCGARMTPYKGGDDE